MAVSRIRIKGDTPLSFGNGLIILTYLRKQKTQNTVSITIIQFNSLLH